VPSTSGYYKAITVNSKNFDFEWVRWYDDVYKIEAGDRVVKHKDAQWMSLIKKK
jgi:hypothetical protein